MKKTLLWFAGLAAVASAATPQKAVKPKAHKVAAHSGTIAGAKAASSKAPGSKSAKSKKSKSKASKLQASKTKRRSNQQAPTNDRYKEIQQALAAKGYLHGDPNGEWGADSVNALKRFQADQNLSPDGKLNSLSLIAMGLGPKRMTAQSQPPAPLEAPRTDVTQ